MKQRIDKKKTSTQNIQTGSCSLRKIVSFKPNLLLVVKFSIVLFVICFGGQKNIQKPNNNIVADIEANKVDSKCYSKCQCKKLNLNQFSGYAYGMKGMETSICNFSTYNVWFKTAKQIDLLLLEFKQFYIHVFHESFFFSSGVPLLHFTIHSKIIPFLVSPRFLQ